MKGNRRNHPPPPANPSPSAAAASSAAASAAAANGLPSPTSPSGKGTAKYTNKDGSKFITVPKIASPVTGSPAPPFSPTQPPESSHAPTELAPPPALTDAPTGNRKKAKRRAKAAARKAEEDSTNMAVTDAAASAVAAAMAPAPAVPNGTNGVYTINLGDNLKKAATATSKGPTLAHHEVDHSGDEGAQTQGGASKSKKSKKKKKKKGGASEGAAAAAQPVNHTQHEANRVQQQLQQQHQPRPQPQPQQPRGPASKKEKIWDTDSQEERQRIKEFWLDLSEDERKSLVKVEKDTVLKKMKEQQKMTCSCHFCGRKRTAIEEELEGLYDSYYEELEQFANDPAGQQQHQQQLQQQRLAQAAAAAAASNSRYSHGQHSHGHSHGHGHAHGHSHGHSHHPHSHAHGHHSHNHSHGHSHPHSAHRHPSRGHQPSRGRIVHNADGEEVDEDELEEEYIDEEEEDLEEEEDDLDEESEEESEEDEEDDDLVDEDEDDLEDDEEDIPPEEVHRDYANDFFNFGNSLQVHGGILTVADDLLKNDGRKFIEMMEQLAERRMAREEDAKDYGAGVPGNRGGPAYAGGMNGAYHHNHLASEEEDYGPEDEDDEDYASDDDEYDEEEDTMTEEQRMEEGRRMFQIFAARMFEQRVLTAYREKVSKERQQRLLDLLDEEAAQEQKAKDKKAKQAQQKKDKAAQKKKAAAEEKARKEAEREAELAARKAEDARRDDEQKRKAEEKRKKREAQRKADEEERKRKEAERQRRINEQKDQEQRAREAKERDKKLKEEARQREREEQEKRERESRERKEKQERDKREKEARARANEARERQRQEERAAQKAAPSHNHHNHNNRAPVPAVPVVPATNNSGGSITMPKRPSSQPHAQPSAISASDHKPVPAPAIPALPLTNQATASPQTAVVTPVSLQKAPTPMRPRQLSQQGGAAPGAGPTTGSSVAGFSSRAASLSGSGPSQSQNASPNPMTPVQSNASFGSASATKPGLNNGLLGGIFGHNPAPVGSGAPFFPTSPLSGTARPVSVSQQHQNQHQFPPGSPTGMQFSLHDRGQPPVTLPPGFGSSQPGQGQGQGVPFGSGFRSVTGPAGIGMMPMLSSSSSASSSAVGGGRAGSAFGPMVPPPPPGFGGLSGGLSGLDGSVVTPIGSLPTDGGIGSIGNHHSHSRQASGGAGFDPTASPGTGGGLASLPIGRPAPIGRPGSTVHGQRPGMSPDTSGDKQESANDNGEDLLGSRALLDDSDFSMDGFSSMRSHHLPMHARPGFGPAPGVPPPVGVDLTSPFMSPSSVWAPLPQQQGQQGQQSSPGQPGQQPHPQQQHLPHLQHLHQQPHMGAFPPPQSAFGGMAAPPGMVAPPGMGVPPGMGPPGMVGPPGSGWGMPLPMPGNPGLGGLGGLGGIGNIGGIGGIGAIGNGGLSGFGGAPMHGSLRSAQAQGRSVTLRRLLCRACEELATEPEESEADGEDKDKKDDTSTSASLSDGFLPIDRVKNRVSALATNMAIGPVQDSELDLLYDTIGNAKNGGGNFEVQRAPAEADSLADGPVTGIKYIPDALGRFGSTPAPGNGGDFSGSSFPGNGFASAFGLGGIGGGLGGIGGIGSIGSLGSVGSGGFMGGDANHGTAPIGASATGQR